uniref:Ion-translocating oxidoreductase complex subunit D n=1 Tax=candidate division WOR-3 bacterium TaxID=2052148 RepID=A0A7C4GHA5_UNCW3
MSETSASTRPALVVTSSPHLHSGVTTAKLMWAVVFAMLPAAGGAVYFFGLRAFWVMLIATASAMAFDALGQRMFGRKVTLTDGSAAITGLLLAFNLPPGVPWWLPIVGSAFAMIVVKQMFGGLGHNFVNPALAARAFLMVSWPTHMTTMWLTPRGGTTSGLLLDPAIRSICTDAITTATPLNALKSAAALVRPGCDPNTVWDQLQSWPVIGRLFFGNVSGSLGETSALLLLVGAVFLLILRIIDWRIPLAYIGTVALLALALPGHKTGGLLPYILFHVLAGGLMLGAFYMATDYVTSPLTAGGRWVFGVGCGVLTIIIRLWGGYPEGVCYSILLMNVATPLIDRLARPRLFGSRREKR